MERYCFNTAHEQMLNASIYATKQTVQLRILRDFVENSLKMDMNTIYDLKQHIYIHPTILNQIESIWKRYMSENNTLEENSFMEKILAKDYHKSNDLQKLATLFNKKVTSEDGRRELNILFAVDGYQGKDYKHYATTHLGNLEPYCEAVRKLYRDTSLSLNQIHEVIIEALDEENKQQPTEWVQLFRQSIGEDQFDKIAKMKRNEIEKKKKKNENEPKKRKQDEEENQ